MPISEAARSDLYTGLAEVLGPDRAETLMSAIPLHDLDEVATKGDLALLRSELQGDIASVRTDLSQVANAVAKIDTKVERLVFVLIAGLFAIVVTLIGVGFAL